MIEKDRLSATVDGELLAAGRAAVAAGRTKSLSVWVNEALARQVEHDARVQALERFVDEYEAEHGEITAEEMEAARRSMAERAIVVRGKAASRGKGAA